MLAIAEDPTGARLSEQDHAVYEFAALVALDASSIQQSHVDTLSALGLTDADIADIVFAAAARSFFTRVVELSPREQRQLELRRSHEPIGLLVPAPW